MITKFSVFLLLQNLFHFSFKMVSAVYIDFKFIFFLVSFRDHVGNITPIKNLQLSVSNLQQNPLPTNLARKLLNYVVSTAPDQPSYTINLQPASVQIPQSTPWFESWRDTFLKVQYPSDHEFTKHFMACMIVISSEEENILATLENLNKTIDELQNTTSPQRFPKFFSQNILRFYVVLHDKCQGSAVRFVIFCKFGMFFNQFFMRVL